MLKHKSNMTIPIKKKYINIFYDLLTNELDECQMQWW